MCCREVFRVSATLVGSRIECAAGFCNDVGYQDGDFFNALVGMFGQALAVIGELPASDGEGFLARLDDVCDTSHNFGYGVGESMDALLAMNPSA